MGLLSEEPQHFSPRSATMQTKTTCRKTSPTMAGRLGLVATAAGTSLPSGLVVMGVKLMAPVTLFFVEATLTTWLPTAASIA